MVNEPSVFEPMVNPSAPRKAKLQTILAFLSAIGLMFDFQYMTDPSDPIQLICSRRNLLKIFPLAVLGILDTISTPPLNLLYGATCSENILGVNFNAKISYDSF